MPARDEGANILACLRSIDAAARWAGRPTDVVVAADRCRDTTVALARALRPIACRIAVVEGHWSSASAARRAGTDFLLGQLPAAERSRWWLANTDADCVVPEDWLERHLAHAAQGALAVGGIVRLDRDRTAPALLRSFEATYRLDGPTHSHLHAANLGVRADAYRAAGGWRTHTVVGEDHHLGHDLAAVGVDVVRATDVVVVTSSRTSSTVPGGFASHLARLDASA